MDKGLLLQQASGAHRELLRETAAWHEEYAARHGMDYWCIYGSVQEPQLNGWRENWHPVWDKIFLLQRLLAERYDLILWVDADAVIVGLDANPATAMDESGGIGTVRHPGPPEHWNLGVMVVRNLPVVRELLNAVMQLGPGEGPWYEQAIFNRVVETDDRFRATMRRLDDRWNSTFMVNEAPAPVIMAWHGGWELGVKLARMRGAMSCFVGRTA